jgi:hypothetical protein
LTIAGRTGAARQASAALDRYGRGVERGGNRADLLFD